MKFLILIMAAISTIAVASPPSTEKAANKFCLSDKECIDVVSLELDSLYNQGLNESTPTTVGTLINRKSKSFSTYCDHSPNAKLCEAYKNQLMLRYMAGLLDREND